jgi:hypothetical protein
MGAERIDEVVTILQEKNLEGKVALIAISSGNNDATASVFADVDIDDKRAKQLRLRVYSDPTLIAYKHFETVNGVLNTLFFSKEKFWRNVQGALLFPYYMCIRGRIPFYNAGHPFQQGAIFVLPPSGSTKPIFSNIEERPGWPLLNHEKFISLIKSSLKNEESENPVTVDKKERRRRNSGTSTTRR